jgi:putative addiction module killer protein
MYLVKYTAEFESWLNGLKDAPTKSRLLRRLGRVGSGNLGDVKPVGQGVFEMREFFGSGWRMYYVQHEKVVVVMLGGGDKATQTKDIEQAIAIWQALKG